MPQWIAREYLARRGGARFNRKQVAASRCPLLGWSPHTIMVEGRTIGPWFFEVDRQPEVGERAYDEGAEILKAFFHRELENFIGDDLVRLGRQIIDCCLSNGTIDDYVSLIPHESLEKE